MIRTVIFTLVVVAAALAVGCGGTAPNANNTNINKNTAILAPNANTTPVTVPNVNPGTVNGNTAPNANMPRPPGAQMPGVEEKMRKMRESGNIATNPSAPRDVAPPPPAKKTP